MKVIDITKNELNAKATIGKFKRIIAKSETELSTVTLFSAN